MTQAVQSNPAAQIESVARVLPRSAQEDFRVLMRDVVLGNLAALSPGGNLLQPGGAPAGSSQAPVGVTHTVTGANGVATVAINNPPSAKSVPIYHEISYSPLKSFTQNVTTLPPTTAPNVTIPQSGVSAFYRLRSSFDKKTWSDYQFPTTGPNAVDAGLVESGAMAAAAAFNQSNFAVVNSQAGGGAAIVTVSGPGGDLTPYTATRGTAQKIRPSATIVGVTPETDQFVGFDGSQFHLKPTLAGVLADNLEPVGKVSVVSTATPTPPTIVPIISGGAIIAYNVTNGGAGASQPYTITITDSGGGTGATAGAQDIQNGVLISLGPGNPGTGYTGATTVVATGGGPGGQPGGGTAVGGNGARMTAV